LAIPLSMTGSQLVFGGLRQRSYDLDVVDRIYNQLQYAVMRPNTAPKELVVLPTRLPPRFAGTDLDR